MSERKSTRAIPPWETIRECMENKDIYARFPITNGADKTGPAEGGRVMKVTDQIRYEKWKDANNDPYGQCVFTFAERWAELMETEIAAGKKIEDIAIEMAEKANKGLDITGAMYGYAVRILALSWEYGEQLRVWHNAKYGHSGTGVVNPAFWTIGKKGVE